MSCPLRLFASAISFFLVLMGSNFSAVGNSSVTDFFNLTRLKHEEIIAVLFTSRASLLQVDFDYELRRNKP